MKRYLHVYLTVLVLGACSTSDPVGCEQQYQALDARHRQVMAMTPGSRAYLDALLDIEDAIFPLLERCPENPKVLGLMAEIQLSQGKYPLAELYARKAVEHGQRQWQAHSVLGSALVAKQQYAEGINHLEQSVTLAPDNMALQLNLCQAYALNQQSEKAGTLCSKVANSADTRLAELAKKILHNINQLDSSTP
jgi:predicted Zn-dependent protease